MAEQLWGTQNLEAFEKRVQASGLEPLLETSYLAWEFLGREGRLDLRTKVLLLIACDVALRSPDALRQHIAAGLRNGLHYDDIAEALSQVTPYVGLPAGFAAMAVLEKFPRSDSQ